MRPSLKKYTRIFLNELNKITINFGYGSHFPSWIYICKQRNSEKKKKKKKKRKGITTKANVV